MDGFFEKYGRVIIIAVAICFVLLYLTPMRNVVGSSINGFTGNFANKVGESLEAVKMPDGSGDIAKEKSSTIIGGVLNGDNLDAQFANAIPEQATSVAFTDEVAPMGVSTTDLTVAKDGDVVGWLDGTTWKVSTQDPNKAVTFNESCLGMFVLKANLTSISFDNVDTSRVMEMGYMFHGCSNLVNLDLSSFDTSNVNDMFCTFNGCSSLKNINLSSFDTSNVKSMTHMFRECSSLTSLDLSNFNTSNLTETSCVFMDCTNLVSLDLSSFDTSKVTDMVAMFSGCSNLTNISVGPKWETKKVTDDYDMFYNCEKLPNFNASVTDVTKAHAGPGGYLTLKV